MTEEIKAWIEDGNAHHLCGGVYIEQTTQWRKLFTEEELIEFYNKEYK